MKKIICILISMTFLISTVNAMAEIPDDCMMKDVYTTWSSSEVYTGDKVTLTVHASGCGNNYTFQYQLSYIGDIINTDNGLWITDAPKQGYNFWSCVYTGYMYCTETFVNTKAPTFNFIPQFPGFYYVFVSITDTNGHTAFLPSMRLCVMTPGIETPSSMMWSYTKAAVDEVVTPGMTDRQKAIALHDWVTQHTRYGYTDMSKTPFADFGSWTTDYCTLSTFITKEGVCAEYADIYQMLCSFADIPCIVVNSTSMNHAWNAVRIDGEWLQVDCTWDDQLVYGIGMDRPLSGGETREYLFMNEKQIAARNWDNDEARLVLGVSK